MDSGVGVFDKGEMNIYAELVPVIDLITDHLRTSWIYQKDINEVNLPDSLKVSFLSLFVNYHWLFRLNLPMIQIEN